MRFVKTHIQFLVVSKHLILLIVFNMPAHNYYGLPHQKHKKTAYQSKDDQYEPHK